MATLEPVDFPHGHLETAAVVGGTLTMLAGIIAAPTVGGASLVVAIVFSGMVAASAGTAVSADGAANPDGAPRRQPAGFDTAGLRAAGRGPLLRVVAGMVLLIAFVAFVSATTRAWWVGIGAAPLAMRMCLLYARRWRPVEAAAQQQHGTSAP
ncbi:MAG: hypothetical protein AAGC46_02720 [Solirubrobacteraceae bacterium]|nr:hypothetical protein [Patulibacter sp.]